MGRELRYRTRSCGAAPTAVVLDHHPARIVNLTVFEPAEPERDTGILAPNGDMITRYDGPEPIGFLWDRAPQISV